MGNGRGAWMRLAPRGHHTHRIASDAGPVAEAWAVIETGGDVTDRRWDQDSGLESDVVKAEGQGQLQE